jgi:glyoxylase-like metal-dependent hydrolase (beta-lactamase superfamily II)
MIIASATNTRNQDLNFPLRVEVADIRNAFLLLWVVSAKSTKSTERKPRPREGTSAERRLPPQARLVGSKQEVIMVGFAGVASIQRGDITITFLADGGAVTEPTVSFPASDPEGWKRHPEFLNDDGRLVTSIGGFLIQTGDRTIVVDTGLGPTRLDIPDVGFFQGGEFLHSLAETDVSPRDVTDVIFTHLHSDHTGWTTRPTGVGPTFTFPNARHYTTDAEWSFWRAEEQPFGPPLDTVLRPLEERVEMLHDGITVAPGVDVVATPGHTPGHVSLVVSSGDERAIILGDVLHCPVQLLEPEWSIVADIDPELARRTRERLYDELEQPHTITGVNHFADAVFGRIILAEGKRTWHVC